MGSAYCVCFLGVTSFASHIFEHMYFCSKPIEVPKGLPLKVAFSPLVSPSRQIILTPLQKCVLSAKCFTQIVSFYINIHRYIYGPLDKFMIICCSCSLPGWSCVYIDSPRSRTRSPGLRVSIRAMEPCTIR